MAKLPHPNGWAHLIVSLALLGISLVLILARETTLAATIITAVSAGWGFAVVTTRRPR